jgi:hypothetical protein
VIQSLRSHRLGIVDAQHSCRIAVDAD